MIVLFRCPQCKAEVETDLARGDLECPGCGAAVSLRASERMRRDNVVDHCAVCDCPQVYVQKDFNRTLGVAVFVAGAAASLVLYGMNRVLAAFGVLLACAVADALLYRFLPEVTICYRCHSQYRRFSPHPANGPFELGLAEKFDPLDRRAGAENPAADWKER